MILFSTWWILSEKRIIWYAKWIFFCSVFFFEYHIFDDFFVQVSVLNPWTLTNRVLCCSLQWKPCKPQMCKYFSSSRIKGRFLPDVVYSVLSRDCGAMQIFLSPHADVLPWMCDLGFLLIWYHSAYVSVFEIVLLSLTT